MRDPRTPDCGVEGCTRAEYSMGLCRKHKAQLPMRASIESATEAMHAQMSVARKHRERAIEYVNADVAARRG